MKQLLIEEMKRAVEIMESKPEIKTTRMVPDAMGGDRLYPETDRETTELFQLLHSIRRHSIILEKDVRKRG